MKKYLLIIFLTLNFPSILGQTPFDEFSPETSRLLLGVDSKGALFEEQHADTIKCIIKYNMQQEQMLFLEIHEDLVVALAPLNLAYKKWLSVDPLVDKNIAMSPYIYCNGNPIMLVDPDGREISIEQDGVTYSYGEREGIKGFYSNGKLLETEFANKCVSAIESIRSGGICGAAIINESINCKERIWLNEGSDKNWFGETSSGKPAIVWNPNGTTGGLNVEGNSQRPAFIGLAHEFAHALSFIGGWFDDSVWFSYSDFHGNVNVVNADEKWACYVENRIRRENNIPDRKYYLPFIFLGAELSPTNSMQNIGYFKRVMSMSASYLISPIAH